MICKERESDGTYICRLCGKRPRGLDQALAHLESAAHHAKLSQHRVAPRPQTGAEESVASGSTRSADH